MEAKSLEVANAAHAPSTLPASTSVSADASGDRSWWQWTHGKSGSISSSSGDVSAVASTLFGQSSSTAVVDGTANSAQAADGATSSALPSWGTMRWEKRTTRTGQHARDDRSSNLTSSVRSSMSPKFTASLSASSSSFALNNRGARGAAAAPRKKLIQSSIRSARDISVRKRFTTSSASGLHDFALPAPLEDGRTGGAAPLDRDAHDEIKWSLAPGKRKVVKKDKKFGRTASIQHPLSRMNGGVHRPLRAWLDSGARASEASALDRSFDFDIHMLEEKPNCCVSPTSTASTISSSASVSLALSFGPNDPVTTCAKAILVDCYRERQYVESSGLRKRTLEGGTKTERSTFWSYPRELSKSPDTGGFSCGSSSSDDELKEVSRFGDNKSDRDSECKSTPEEERYRQLMLLHAYDISSSPEVDIGSPLLEEKGLSAEVRYQLPLARGTANETDKECTICKTRYNIGDHICTLPCQHYFHYRCVDQWLCSHTSCPLCRWDVTADANNMSFHQKHQLTECSPSDREAFQRKMRPSTHSAGFRPVVPEVDQLHQRLATLRLQEETADGNDDQVKYLVCPTPQRPERK